MKICDRDYSKNVMYTTKLIKGIACCPNCEKPAICHGKPIAQRALFWSLSGDTGVSSETLCAFMTNNPRAGHSSPPSDSADRGRCIRLLELIPEWIPRLSELAAIEKPQESLVFSSSGMRSETNSWAAQIPLMMSEGNL